MPVVDHSQILRVQKAAVAIGLDTMRDALLGGIPRALTATFSGNPNPAAQLLSDLSHLNELDPLADGTVPLHTWLSNALRLSDLRLEATVFQQVLDLAQRAPPTATPPEPPASPWQDYLPEIERAAQPLLTLPQTLSEGDSGAWIDRPELSKLLDALHHDGKPLVLLGDPGTGKSALLSRLASELHRRGTALLAIRADQMLKEIDSIDKLQRWLDLSSSPAVILKAIAEHRRVVLLIDQLDALCDLVDVHTQRLSVLLRLVADVNGTPGLGIVLSCRAFDFRHDRRLQGLSAKEIRLEPLGAQEVQRVLKDHGIAPGILSQPFVEGLRAPQHLKTFLALLDGKNRIPVFDTYQQMLEALWQERVLGPEGDQKRERLLVDIATYMAKEEELSAPVARFSAYKHQLDQLEAAGILQREDKRRIAFTHQTWFAFTRARLFITSDERLCDYVQQRSGSLFVRATVWSALVNLREASPRRYHGQLDALWKMPELRIHLRALLLEFLGQLDDPRDEEAAILLPVLKQEGYLRRVALGAMVGSQGWFRRIADRYLPDLMTGPHAAEVWGTLAKGWSFDRQRVLSLLERHWVHEPTRLNLALVTFRDLKVWDERAVGSVLAILAKAGRASGPFRSSVSMVMNSISAHEPMLALRVVRVILDQDLQQCRAASSDTLQHDRFNHPCRALLEGSHDLPDIIKLAQTAPGAFLEQVWPWFVDVLGELGEPEHPLICAYRDHRSMIRRRRKREIGRIDELPEAIGIAVEGLARQDAVRFLAFVKRCESSDLLYVHELLAAGLKEVAPHRADQVIEYLLADPRRLVVGDHEDPIYATCELIEVLAPHLDLKEEQRMEAAISRSCRYTEKSSTDKAEWRFRRQKDNRLHRLRLHRALEKSEHMSPRARALIDEESRALADSHDRTVSTYGLRAIQSPMLATQMSKAKDEDIINLFRELPDSTEWTHPSRWLQGGSIEASRELADFTKTEPERALRIISHFDPGTHERPVAYVVEALSTTDLPQPVGAIEALIIQLEERGFASSEYRDHVARALCHLAIRGAGLADRSCELLQGWLEDSVEEAEVEQSKGSQRSHSILWQEAAGGLLPHGNFTILRALIFGYMRRQPAAVEQLLSVLEVHVSRTEQTRVWRALLTYLRDVPESERLQNLMELLFTKHPEARDCVEGALGVADMRWCMKGDTLHAWLHGIRDSRWSAGAQAYGELLMLLTGCRTELAWVKQELDAALHADAMAPEHDQVRLGLAYAAVRLWSAPEYRGTSTSVILQLIPRASGDLAMAIMEVFGFTSALPGDDHTTQLLDALLDHDHRSLLSAGAAHNLVSRLKEICAEEPRRVSMLCNALLDEIARVEDGNYGLDRAEGDLIDISVTLQRLHDYREEGLDLFERLLKLEIYGTRDMLHELDVRPRLSVITRTAT